MVNNALFHATNKTAHPSEQASEVVGGREVRSEALKLVFLGGKCLSQQQLE